MNSHMNGMTRWIVGMALMMVMLLSVSPPAMAQRNDNFYRGARSHGGYYNDRNDRRYHDDRRYQHDQGGIGPGYGALIGAGGGAALGALFGGGAKGALIGGAAGAGVGAIAGKVHQDNKRRDYRERYDRYGRPY